MVIEIWHALHKSLGMGIDRIYFLTECDEFPVQLPDVYQVINVLKQPYFPANCPNINRHYTYITLMRAVLSNVLPDESKVLLLDPDTIVTGSLEDLWNIDITNYYFAAVQETRNHTHPEKIYYNAGVMLMNLNKFRIDHIDDLIITELNTRHWQHMEQDVLNHLCNPEDSQRVLPLESKYNASFVTDPTDDERIHHYLAYAKPMFWTYAKPYADMSFDYIFTHGANRKEGAENGN